MESKLNFIAEHDEWIWKNLSEEYYGIQTYLKEAITKSIMFDIQPHLLLNHNHDKVVEYILNHHQKDLPLVMKNVSLYSNHP